ncbi:MBOAT family protein [bacterium 1XD8-76]|nr:MBOAT family protein [bacterium 1XD8-76]
MLFNSYIFLFLFLPVTLVFYYLLNRYKKYTQAKFFLIGMSGWFYAYFNVSYLILLCASVAVNYFFHCRICREKHKTDIVTGVGFNLLLLCYFKYFDFFIENINMVFGASMPLKNIVLPLGISFFTFQQISFLVDTYRGEAKRCGFTEYALFVVFFPQLIAGPIVTCGEMMDQFRDPARKKPDMNYLTKGVMLFTLGLVKKVILADTLGQAVDWGYDAIEVLDSTNAFLISVLYTFQLYFDFSGYCDMAKGIGCMLHIDLPANFHSPYQSTGIMEFWKRWHITLGRFFTKYVYIPLGGNRNGRWKTCRNSFIVFSLSGLWHGANWTFVLWGVMHGVGYIIDYLGKPIWKKLPRALSVFLTFCFVNLAFVAFRAPDLSTMCDMYRQIFSGGIGLPMAEIAVFFHGSAWNYLFEVVPGLSVVLKNYGPFVLFMALALYLVFVGKNAVERAENSRFQMGGAIAAAILFLYCVVSLSGVSSFLYFNF